MLNEEILVPLFFFLTVIALAVGVPLARAFARRMDRQRLQPPVTPEVLQRLERMENAIDAVAVEIERISENQRFTTRLLTEREAPVELPPARQHAGAGRPTIEGGRAT
jgi:hypothetical protein